MSDHPPSEIDYGDDYDDRPCRDPENHKQMIEFCADHQLGWCRVCDRICPDCVDDPCCPDCGCHLNEEYHDWDCAYAGDDDEL